MANVRALNPTAWMFICRNKDGFHPTRNLDDSAWKTLGDEYVEYLLIHDARIERSGESSFLVIPQMNAFHLIDDPPDSWVMALLGTKMLANRAPFRYERPCRFCRAKGIKS